MPVPRCALDITSPIPVVFQSSPTSPAIGRFVPLHSALYGAVLSRENCLQIKLAYKRVPVESACGNVESFDLHGITWLFESGRVAKFKRRMIDGKVTRVMLLALPGEMAHNSPRSTVVQDLPMTYAHRDNPKEWLCRRPLRIADRLAAVFA